ncbi:MAG: ATP-binding protein [Thermoanaerobaculum sp.]|nr:ATP-binding protein [Thermoanaerobaculum sp.]
MNTLSASLARSIIKSVGDYGIPPEFGLEHFTVGLDRYLDTLDKEYLSSFVREGGAAFKMLVANYGGGKTHFFYCLRNLAWQHRFVVSYVELRPGESPFHKLELVYSAIARGLVPPLTNQELLGTYEKGMGPLLRRWAEEKRNELTNKGLEGNAFQQAVDSYLESLDPGDSVSFSRAVRAAFRVQLEDNGEDFENLVQWLTGEGFPPVLKKKYGITQKVDKTTALMMLRSLARWIRQIGYSGLVVLFDEAEQVPSLPNREKELHLGNLRQIVDECGHASFQGLMMFYAVPDESFLEGRANVYEALRQRLATVFTQDNPSGVKIRLEDPAGKEHEILVEIGRRLAKIYSIAYECPFEPGALQTTVTTVAQEAHRRRFGDVGYKRVFMKLAVQGFSFLRKTRRAPEPTEVEQWEA